MSDKCAKCEDALPTDGGLVLCRGCNGNYHYKCSIKASTYENKGKAEKSKWRCERCRTGGKRLQDDEATPIEKQKDIGQLALEIAKMSEQIKENTKCQKFVAEQYDEIIKGQQDLGDHIKNLERQIAHLMQSCADKDRKISSLQARINEMEQKQYEKNFEVHGVIETEEEDEKSIVCRVTEKMGIALTEDDIEVASRLEKRKQDDKIVRNRPIIVMLKSKKKRDEIIQRRRITVLNSEIVNRKEVGKIYVVEQLSSYNKSLLWEAKNRAREKEWKFVWVQNCNVLARKEEGSRIINLKDFDDINKIK